MSLAHLTFKLFAAAALIAGAAQAAAKESCTPVLAFEHVKVTEALQPPASGRLWFAVVSVDASACEADAKGSFEIVFSRLKENAPDLAFREEFVWASPAVQVGLHLAADEAIGRHWVGSIESCACGR